MHNYEDLIAIFHDCFFEKYNTRLVKGDTEPLYVPANESQPHHMLYFAHGFYASALHECSHWLIAGENRRKLEDFGYWYVPDGRSASEQILFQSVEVKPQALEWILSRAAQFKFNVSIDNLYGTEAETIAFKKAVHNQVKEYCEKGLPARANAMRNALCRFYNSPLELSFEDFQLKMI